ncbi:MAG TPA: universal stress protein, partial [Candidatus Acidoferrales bacterium]|nr:universal stress protein [Candidatus Acidoferrales bacterium]
GYASGVGKSYRILDEARRRHERGEDVVIGAVQGQRSQEVQALVERLEMVPPCPTSDEQALDVEAVLRRRPQVCVVDPLAFKNPAGSRHAHRWQDVEELLRAGISVLTGINLLHIEEFCEKVEAITGKHTTETIPKAFLLAADEIVIVDVPPDLALARMGEKLTPTGISNERERQLSELRELALLLTAEVVEAQLESYLRAHGIEPLYGTQERILVCITPRSDALSMIASGKRNKERFHGELFVVYVRQPHLSANDRAAIDRYLAAAREAGAVVEILESRDPASAIIEFARRKRITQIFVGHSLRRNWRDRLFGDPVQQLIRAAERMDVRIFPH